MNVHLCAIFLKHTFVLFYLLLSIIAVDIVAGAWLKSLMFLKISLKNLRVSCHNRDELKLIVDSPKCTDFKSGLHFFRAYDTMTALFLTIEAKRKRIWTPQKKVNIFINGRFSLFFSTFHASFNWQTKKVNVYV